MKIYITEDYEEMSLKAAEIISEIVRQKPDAVLGLATGSSPIGLYDRLSQFCKEGLTSFKRVKTVNLDEYEGLGTESEQSYVSFMRSKLFNRIDIDLDNTYLPDGKAADMQKECGRYSALLSALPQDVQVLGLGSNGHIGFNEPYTPFNSKTHVVELAESTIRDNARLFEDAAEVPKKAITMGIEEIMCAKKILVLVSGANKADAVHDMVKGEISEACPASVLQKHPDVTLIADRAAAAKL